MRSRPLQPYGVTQHQFGIIGFGHVGLDTEAHSHAIQAGKQILHPDALIKRLFGTFGRMAHFAVKIPSERHGQFEPTVVGLMLYAQSQ